MHVIVGRKFENGTSSAKAVGTYHNEKQIQYRDILQEVVEDTHIERKNSVHINGTVMIDNQLNDILSSTHNV